MACRSRSPWWRGMPGNRRWLFSMGHRRIASNLKRTTDNRFINHATIGDCFRDGLAQPPLSSRGSHKALADLPSRQPALAISQIEMLQQSIALCAL
jgi:hypothetical protein